MKTSNNLFVSIFISLILIVSLGMVACEGTSGADGPQGPQGPIGPAGENGSIIHAGQGTPDASIGNPGDYYLDTQNTFLYGPKTEGNSWGTPIDLKGADGQDGSDGENGSQIFSGITAPDTTLGDVGDYYLNTATFDLYGPKTVSGWGTPINLQANANVTLYTFDGHDFSESGSTTRNIFDLTDTEFNDSSWLFYLVLTTSSQGDILFQIPGYGDFFQTFYNPVIRFRDFDVDIDTDDLIQTFIAIADGGPGENYDEIRVIRTATSNVVDNRTSAPKTASSKGYHLDMSNHEEVAKYYGLSNKNTIHISKP